jgi:crotonobetainyl-CoA:carnitine CoA-transferase CaiB-like acyl-CoA transferase
VANWTALYAAIEAVLGARTGEQAVERFAVARVAHAPRREVTAVLAHSRIAARGRWTQVDSPAGPIPALLPPIRLPVRPSRMDKTPEVGEHTDALLRWFAREGRG